MGRYPFLAETERDRVEAISDNQEGDDSVTVALQMCLPDVPSTTYP